MRTRVTVLNLLCVCVCPLSTSCLQGLYYKLNIAAGFTLIFLDFQLTDFSQMLSFMSYSNFAHFLLPNLKAGALRVWLGATHSPATNWAVMQTAVASRGRGWHSGVQEMWQPRWLG